MQTFSRFLATTHNASIYLPNGGGGHGRDRGELIAKIDDAVATCDVQRCDMGRGRGATALAIATAAWLETVGFRFPVFVAATQDEANCYKELLKGWRSEGPTMFVGLGASPRGLIRRETLPVVDEASDWAKVKPGGAYRPDFLIVDTPYRDYGSESMHAKQRELLAGWLRIFGPSQPRRGILINC